MLNRKSTSWLAITLLALSACTSEPLVPPVTLPTLLVKATDQAINQAFDEVAVGQLLFKDPRLSSSGKMACATCHTEAFGHADVPGVHLPMGGPLLDRAGNRSSPTTRYLNTNPPFSLDAKGRAWGGFTWDGRANSRADQAKDPFFDRAEMALDGTPLKPDALLKLVRSADYFPKIRQWYANDDLSNDALLFRRILQALEVYQRDDLDYNRFDSRFDLHLAGKITLSAQEQRGQDIFNNARQGNCMSCHSTKSVDKKPVFTDFSFHALGVPRNPKSGAIVANAKHFDLGLCKSGRKLPVGTEADRYCGAFKTPTLRNIERSAPYFHNASVATLEEAVRFHFTRETEAARWYGSRAARYNDLPKQYHRNVVNGQPFDGRWKPSATDMQALLAFLKTLNDIDQTEPLAVSQR